jgi:hypothetical protein
LLDVPKTEIVDYAKRHGLVWREDSTNADTQYLRNKVRLDMVPNWSDDDKRRLLDMTLRMRNVNQEIDAIISNVTPALNRKWFILLPHNISREVMAGWLRSHGIREFNSDTLERLTVAAKTTVNGKSVDIVKGHRMVVSVEDLALKVAER